MRDIQKIDDGLIFIEHSYRFQWFVGVIVVFGKREIGLVDTGYENTPLDYVFPFLEQSGRSLEEISYVVNTHNDRDHNGGNKAIKEATKAKIAIHELDAPANGFADVKLKDGDIVKLGDREFSILHTPGHTPGSISLFERENGLLFSGDSVVGDRIELIRMNPKTYINSLEKLMDIEFDVLVMPHPFKPVGRAILRGEESKSMIRSSISNALIRVEQWKSHFNH